MQEDDTRDPALAAPLAALRAGMAQIDAPPGVHKDLMAAFASRHRPPRRWYQRLPGAQWPLAGAIGGAAAVLLLFVLALQAPPPPTGAAAPLLARDDNGAAFIALDSFERIEGDPAPRMVDAVVPRTALASLGVPVSPENAGDLVHAEMLVGYDGQPLALRLAAQ